MAARAIVGIALGMLFAPVIYLLVIGAQFPAFFSTPETYFLNWITGITTDFNNFLMSYASAGMFALQVPLISLFSPLLGLGQWLSWFIAGMITWAIIGMWAGAIERSAGRGIGVAVGVWLGWIIIELIFMAVTGSIALFLAALLDQWFGVVIAIIFAAIFGAITKSEEF